MPHDQLSSPELIAHFSALQKSTRYLPMNELEDGCLYLIHARNSYIGIWRANEKGFIVLRKKFNDLFLAREFHWDTGEPFGTAKPFLKIGGPSGEEDCRTRLDDAHARISHVQFMEMTRSAFAS